MHETSGGEEGEVCRNVLRGRGGSATRLSGRECSPWQSSGGPTDGDRTVPATEPRRPGKTLRRFVRLQFSLPGACAPTPLGGSSTALDERSGARTCSEQYTCRNTMSICTCTVAGQFDFTEQSALKISGLIRCNSQYLREIARKTRNSRSPRIQALKQLIIINHNRGTNKGGRGASTNIAAAGCSGHDPSSLSALLDSGDIFDGLDFLTELGSLVATEAACVHICGHAAFTQVSTVLRKRVRKSVSCHDLSGHDSRKGGLWAPCTCAGQAARVNIVTKDMQARGETQAIVHTSAFSAEELSVPPSPTEDEDCTVLFYVAATCMHLFCVCRRVPSILKVTGGHFSVAGFKCESSRDS